MLSGRFRLLMGCALALTFSLAAAKGTVKKMDSAQKIKPRMTLESPAFKAGAMIPRRHTCEGQNLSPALVWKGEPEATHSLALVVDDPDAPSKTWVHWVIFNLPPGQGELPEGMATDPSLVNGTRQGTNDSGKTGWDGPCPPSGGPHRYYFHLYALDEVLGLGPKWNKEQLVKVMKGHILAEATLMGTYQRTR
jgi:Raf kinase inhibitor-like YbhB/YbcL family protein